MSETNVKRGRGKPRILSDEERTERKARYMLNKAWYCEICKTGRNYKLAGKHCHLQRKKHIKNATNQNIEK